MVSRFRAPGGALERLVFGDIGAPGTVLFLFSFCRTNYFTKPGTRVILNLGKIEEFDMYVEQQKPRAASRGLLLLG